MAISAHLVQLHASCDRFTPKSRSEYIQFLLGTRIAHSTARLFGLARRSQLTCALTREVRTTCASSEDQIILFQRPTRQPCLQAGLMRGVILNNGEYGSARGKWCLGRVPYMWGSFVQCSQHQRCDALCTKINYLQPSCI